MAHVKTYNPGQITLDLPRTNYFYELPLLSVDDFHGGFSVTLVHSYDAKKNNKNHFNMREGYKLNVQKRLLLSNGVPCQYIDASYKMISLLDESAPVYTFADDSQRILRVSNNGGFAVEYLDGSKENFDSSGYVTSVLDKYGTMVFAYTYDSANKLTSLTYRSNKTVSFSYNSIGGLSALTYASYATSFAYSSSGIDITLFSGEYVRLMSGGYRFISLVGDRSTSGIITSKNMIDISGTLAGEYIISATVKKMVYDADGNGTETWSSIYDFPNLNYPDHSYNQVDITDYYGVKKRVQYLKNKPQFSYEIGENDVEFIPYIFTSVYPSSVDILSTDEGTSQTSVVGTQGLINGVKMTESLALPNGFETTLSDDFNSPTKGWYLLTGWAMKEVEDASDSENADQCEIVIAHTIDNQQKLSLDLTPVNKWKYFSTVIYCYSNEIKVRPDGDLTLHLKDLRLTRVANSEETNYLFTSSYGLMPFNDLGQDHDSFIPLSECGFYINDELIDDVYYDDVLKYRINRRNEVHPLEFYSEKVSRIVPIGLDNQITVKYIKDNTSMSFNLDSCYLGQRILSLANETIYQYLVHDADDTFLAFKTVKEGGDVISYQKLDSHYNTVMTEKDSVNTYYDISDTGLLTAESVRITLAEQLYSRTYAYSADGNENPTLTVTDEFNAQTVYTYDAVWGRPISVTLPDGTVVTDVYDDSMRALLGRTVGGTGGRTNQLGYTDGLLSAMQTGDLSYSFAYTNDKLTGVSRQGVSIEEYEHTMYQTSAYYPSKTNKSYGITENYDKYGRLLSVDGVVSNAYGTLTSLSDMSASDITLTPDTEIVNSSSVLATSEDLVANETNAYQYYANNKQVAVRTVTNSTDNSVKCTETFTYDNENRLASHATQHNTPTVFSVKGTVNYVSHISAIDTTSKVGEYNYYINNSLASRTVNYYDIYDRKEGKTVYFANGCLNFGYEFNKTRVSRCFNTIMADNEIVLPEIEYQYDPLGRIVREINSNYAFATDYTYDTYGQLVREDNPIYGNTFTYSYDTYGNITQVRRYSYNQGSLEGQNFTVFPYVYGATAKDRLTSYNGNTISYNNYGYVSSYKGENYSWKRGRLAAIVKGNPKLTNGDYKYCSFTYNAYGQRTAKNYVYDSKTVNYGSPHPTYKTNYWYDGSGRLIREYCIETFKDDTTINTHELIYLYDNECMVGVRYSYNGAAPQNYFYVRNLHGDVVAIYNANGVKQAEYAYDAYGNCKITNKTNANLANYNPIRYRGYYYDRETGLYYLNARYYNPEWRRFLSHDLSAYLDPESVNGLNLYAYCMNNPVMYVDPSGHSATAVALLVGAILGGVIGGVYGALTASANGQDVGMGILIGAFAGIIMGAGAGVASLYLAPVILGTTATVANVTYSTGAALAIGTGIAFCSGFVGGATADMFTQLANDGAVYDFSSVIASGLQYGVINTSSAFLGSLGAFSPLESGILSVMFGSVFSAIGMTIDVIRNRQSIKKRT